jgi:hypothetical protein
MLCGRPQSRAVRHGPEPHSVLPCLGSCLHPKIHRILCSGDERVNHDISAGQRRHRRGGHSDLGHLGHGRHNGDPHYGCGQLILVQPWSAVAGRGQATVAGAHL